MVLLVAIVIAFVFTIGQVPFLGDRNRSWDNAKEFYGYDLSDEGVRSNLQTLAVYDAILGNKNLRTQRQLTQLMLRQAYLLSLARELGIIQVSETELKEYVQSAPAFRNAAGGFDAAAWKKVYRRARAHERRGPVVRNCPKRARRQGGKASRRPRIPAASPTLKTSTKILRQVGFRRCRTLI